MVRLKVYCTHPLIQECVMMEKNSYRLTIILFSSEMLSFADGGWNLAGILCYACCNLYRIYLTFLLEKMIFRNSNRLSSDFMMKVVSTLPFSVQ